MLTQLGEPVFHGHYYIVQTCKGRREVWLYHERGSSCGWYRPGDEEICPIDWATPLHAVDVDAPDAPDAPVAPIEEPK